MFFSFGFVKIDTKEYTFVPYRIFNQLVRLFEEFFT